MVGSWGRRRRGFPLKLGEKLSGERRERERGNGLVVYRSLFPSSFSNVLL